MSVIGVIPRVARHTTRRDPAPIRGVEAPHAAIAKDPRSAGQSVTDSPPARVHIAR